METRDNNLNLSITMCNAKWRLHLVFEKKLAGSENKAKKSTAKIAVLHKITMDRQGKCTGSEKNSSLATMSGIPDHLQTQHHNHKAKSNSVPGY
ncbi:hypothetical protein JQS65_05730 [Yersinia enterocolitica subsp. palearctica]|nr:hypothetical protein [Yersinia enterocolitica subsp. palearctica]